MNKKENNKKDKRLQKGESQLKDGHYQYRYKDADGKYRYLTSWRLMESDVTPEGKKNSPPLRIQERELREAEEKKIDYFESKRLLLNDLFDKWINTVSKGGIDTKHNYMLQYNKHIRDGLGKRRAVELRPSDFQALITTLSKKCKKKTISTILEPVIASLDMAVNDGLLSRNVAHIAKKNSIYGKDTADDTGKTLTIDETERLLSFMANNDKYSYWLPFVILLADTGCRIGELCGLCWSDINWKGREINIRRTLEYYKRDGEFVRCVKQPKTKDGSRIISMTDSVYHTLLRLHMEIRTVEPVDGISDFIFCNTQGRTIIRNTMGDKLNQIVKDYNETVSEDMALPHLYPHKLRHAYITNMLNLGKSPSLVQKLAGHADVSMTLRYAEHSPEDLKEAVNDYSKISPANAVMPYLQAL